jgi:hypothetical protein
MHRDAMPDADPAALAKPETVATRFVELLSEELPPTGSRIALSGTSS